MLIMVSAWLHWMLIRMMKINDKLGYSASTALFALLAILFLGVLITSLGKDAIDMCVRVGFNWRHTGNYVGLIGGFIVCFFKLN